MSQNNITENLFGAIDVIIAQKIKGLQFDLTKICTITDNNKAQNGAYTVTDGSITFEAYSENKTYKVGDAVRVSVPNADFTDKKYIIGKYVTDNSITPITYVSPLESILDITNNLVPEETGKKIYRLRANSQGYNLKSFSEPITTIRPNIESLEISEIYDTFYIAAEFRTLLGDYTILDGNYGIRAEFHDGDQIHDIYLDSKDMFGDPYNFAIFTSQSQIYNIEKIKNIDKINLYFYQYNNFLYDNNGEATPLPCNTNLPENLQMTNIAIGFGTMLSNIEDNTAKIYSNSSKEYNKASPSSQEKKINLLWYNKNETGKYLGFDDGEFYDEFEDYIEPKATERVLLSYSGDENVPHDKTGLEIAAALNELNNIVDDTIKYVDEVILPALSNFNISTNTAISDINGKYSDIKDTKKAINDIRNEANEYISLTLQAAAFEYNPSSLTEDEKIDRPEYPNVQEFKYIARISDEYDNIEAALNGMLNYYPESSYLGIYDNLKKEIAKWISVIEEYDNFANIDSIITHKRVNAYQLNDNYAFNIYAGEDFSDLANKYSIYWYRYDPNGLLDNTFVSGDSFVSANWKRDTNIINEKYYTFTANANKNTEEHVMAVVFYNHEYYKSNVITFTNGDKILDDRTENLTANIVLVNGDRSKEAYQLYGSSNSLLNQSEAYYDREVIVQFMENDTTANNSKLDNCQIYWYLPNNSTMLAPSTKNTQAITFDKTSDEQSEYALENYTCYYQPAAAESTNRSFYYRIKDYYVQSATQNHIKCKVVTPDEYSYDATIYFGFSSFGTSGTDYTLHITPIGEQSAVLPDKPLYLKVSLYDYNNELVQNPNLSIGLTPASNYHWSLDSKTNIIEVHKTLQYSGYYGIISASTQVTTQNGKLVNLVAYYPLAYATDNYFIEGTTSIVYNDAGASPIYYKDPYKLYSWENKEQILNVDWEMMDETNTIDNQNILPTITNNVLRPCVMYVDGVNMQPVAKCDGKYYQSIYICQNRYQMSMLNSWDNSLTIDEKNGIILSQIVGAGKKNQNNQFSGVLMGEVDSASNENHNGYGLYGFHEGAQSFSFNVDGTAFLGKSGRGRIMFNGDSGTIESASYQSLNGSAGMKIDLDDGFLHMRGATRLWNNSYVADKQSEIYLGVIEKDGAYFSIDSDAGKRLIHIGKGEYYLQTNNFSNGSADVQAKDSDGNLLTLNNNPVYLSSPGSGTRIDLASGKITSYDFTIDAYNGNKRILLTSDSQATYPFNVNNAFTVQWDGTISATAGTVGISPEYGQLFINKPQNITGGSKELKECQSQTYFQRGTSDYLCLSRIGFGSNNNAFYLGSGGLVMRNYNSIGGYRLTGDGLFIDGYNAYEGSYGEGDLPSDKVGAFYQGSGISFYRMNDTSSAKSILFDNTYQAKYHRFGFTQNGMALTLSQEPFIISTGKLQVTFNNDGNIIINKNNDIKRQNDTKTLYGWISELSSQIKTVDTRLSKEISILLRTIKEIQKDITSLTESVNELEGKIK